MGIILMIAKNVLNKCSNVMFVRKKIFFYGIFIKVFIVKNVNKYFIDNVIMIWRNVFLVMLLKKDIINIIIIILYKYNNHLDMIYIFILNKKIS